jgi:hypothetical protein
MLLRILPLICVALITASIGEHRSTLARQNIKAWIESQGLPYHSPHKFRHGHIHYGLEHAKDIAGFKAISMNALHSSMEITDEFYSNLNDGDVQNRIGSFGKDHSKKSDKQDAIKVLKDLLARLENKDK